MPTPYALSSDLVSAWPAKSLAVAQYVDGYKLDTGPVQNAQTGTSYTFVLADTTKTVTASNAAASTYTVPPQSSVVWEAYTVLRLVNLGAGVVTLTAGAGVTLTGTLTVPQYGSVTMMRTASNAWTISGASGGMTLVATGSLSGSSVNVLGCFTAAYNYYRVYVDATYSTSARHFFRLLDGSTAAITNYAQSYVADSGSATAAAGRVSTATEYEVMYGGGGFTSGNSIVDLMYPFSARSTIFSGNGASTNGDFRANGGAHTTATAYSGLQVLTSAGTFTGGTIRVYGI